MAKIGRNDPCPCGSGKKYKKCCLEKDKTKAFITSDQEDKHFIRWTPEDVRGFSTEDIIQKLINSGVDFNKEQFHEDVKRFYSASDLAQRWIETYSIKAEDMDVNFFWSAALVLWERLEPDIINSEMINDLMQEGYVLIYDQEKCVDGCNLWLEAWEYLKMRYITPDTKSVEDVDELFTGLQCLFNWCQDMEMELENAALKTPSLYEKRIKFCQEFYNLLPESDANIISLMMCAEAESYFALKNVEQGERLFKKAIEVFPASAWNYIRWADQYWLFRTSDDIPIDYEKAEQIYKMALDKNVEDKEEILKRLKELERVRSSEMQLNPLFKDNGERRIGLSPGKCRICNNVFSKTMMVNHLELCKKDTTISGEKTKVFKLLVEGVDKSEYWLILKVRGDATLKHIDNFLRDIWLECCGHLSAFTINGKTYMSHGADRGRGHLSMNSKLNMILEPGIKFYHKYDFGSATELTLKVLSEGISEFSNEMIGLLARNESPSMNCGVCGEGVTIICHICADSRGFKESLFCSDCAEKHECGEDYLLPIANSPRMGVCGYTGG